MQWISVEERLPEDEQKVLIWGDVPQDWNVALFHAQLGIFTIEEKGERERAYKVTHWAEVKGPEV